MILLYATYSCKISPQKIKPIVKDGFMDLSVWDFEKDGIIELEGDWKFKWMEDDPVFVAPDYDDSGWDTLRVPALWNLKTNESYGFCWLRARFAMKPQQGIDLTVKGIFTASAIYINGKKVNESGTAENTREKSVPGFSPAIISLADETETFVIAWKISNYFDVIGGPLQNIYIGTHKQIQYKVWMEYVIYGIILGILFMMACFNFILWVERKTDKANLYFTVNCILTFLRHLNLFIFTFVPINLQWIYEIQLKMEFSTIWQLLFFMFFLKELFVDRKSRHFRNIMSISILCGIVWDIYLIFTPTWIFTKSVIVLQLFSVLISLYILFFIFSNITKNREYAKYIVCGTVVLFLCALYDILTLYVKSLPVNSYILPYGHIIFLFLLSIVISKRYSNSITTAEYLGQNLKEEVAKQTILLTDKKQELELLNLELKKTDYYKTQFFQNVTHELRTPLTLITGPLENITRSNWDALPGTLKEQIDIARRNSYQLVDLINQILDLSKIDAGRMSTNCEKFDFEAFIRSLCNSFEPLATNNDMTYELVTPGNCINIYSDKDKITRILFNILSNAFKFTERRGKISIEVNSPSSFIEKGGKSVSAVMVTISDTGIGMKENELSHIFDRFRQLDGSTTRRYGGTGIGLAIVKEYTELLGGTVSVQSKEGEGTAFTVFIPTNPEMYSDAKDGGASSPAIMSPAFHSIHALTAKQQKPQTIEIRRASERIFIAEDNRDMRAHMTHILRDKYVVAEAEDGETAFTEIIKDKPDLVLADIMMPGMDGYQLLKALHETDSTRDIPVIIVTAKSFEEYSAELSGHVPDDFLSKPFIADELLKRISNVLAIRRQNREIDRFWEHNFLADPGLRVTGDVQSSECNYPCDALDDPLKKTVLLVEDNKELLLYVRDNMKSNYNVLTAENGRHALQKLDKLLKPPHVIISDIVMPEMDGWALYRNILEKKKYRHIPFIFVSAKVDEKIRGLSMGAVDYIVKPFLMDELVSKTESLIRLQDAQKENDTMMMSDKILKALKQDEQESKPQSLFDEKCVLYNITEREKDIVRLVQRGYVDKEIAYELNISKFTVNAHMKNLFKKCNTNNRIELINKIFG